MTTAREAATEVLKEAAMPEVLTTAQKLVELELAVWTWDPSVDGVVGLVKRGFPVYGRPQAWLVVYIDGQDFECSDEFMEEMFK